MGQVILAIDGGGTKTEATLRTCDGTILYHGKSSGSNHDTVGLAQVEKVLLSILTEMSDVYREMSVDIAVFALAGIDSSEKELKVRRVVEGVCRSTHLEVGRLIVENDAESVLRGVMKNKRGVLLISGTGSIAYGQDKDGNIIRAGGWGHLAGDEGSGHWIGTEMVRAIFKAEDGRGPATLLTKHLLNRLGLHAVQDLATWLHSEPYAVEKIAQLTKVLEVCSSEGDREALRITEEAAEELAQLIGSALRKCRLEKEGCPVFIGGGTAINSAVLFTALKKRMKKEFPLCELTLLEKSPIDYVITRGWMTTSE